MLSYFYFILFLFCYQESEQSLNDFEINTSGFASYYRFDLLLIRSLFSRSLLHSSQIDVSYFAAGIMAHLAAEGSEAWTGSHISRQNILTELGDAVANWEPPEGEMVAYRFAIYFSLFFTNFKGDAIKFKYLSMLFNCL